MCEAIIFYCQRDRAALQFGVRSGLSNHKESRSTGGGKDALTEPTRYVRVSLCPPSRYAASTTDMDLWLKLYVRQIGLPEQQWVAELLPLLEDQAFRDVSQLGLQSSTDCGVITASLKHQFPPKEMSWSASTSCRLGRNNKDSSWCNPCGCLLTKLTPAGLQNIGGRSPFYSRNCVTIDTVLSDAWDAGNI